MINYDSSLLKYAIVPFIKSVQLGALYAFFPEKTEEVVREIQNNSGLIAVILATSPAQIKEGYEFISDWTHSKLKYTSRKIFFR